MTFSKLTAIVASSSLLCPNLAFAADNITVSVAGDRPVTVAMITARGSGYAVGAGGQSATATYIGYKDICTAPCKVELQPGINEFMFYGAGAKPRIFKHDFQSPTTDLTVKSSPLALRWAGLGIFAGGLALASVGYLGMQESTWNENDELVNTPAPYGVPALIGGLALFGTGVGLYFGPQTKVTVGPMAPPL